MTLNINLTRRVRRRKLKDGSVVEQTRYVLNWRDPRTGEREQRFFERQRDAQERRSELIAAYDRGALWLVAQNRNRRRRRRRVARDEARHGPADHVRDLRLPVPLRRRAPPNGRGASRDHPFRQRCEAEGQADRASRPGKGAGA